MLVLVLVLLSILLESYCNPWDYGTAGSEGLNFQFS
ncbi:protein of unknown function [Thermococcus nautili]|nr:protein of unknown function [Thermococcus nautili]